VGIEKEPCAARTCPPAEPTSLDRVDGTRFQLDGWLGDYLRNVSEQWIKPAPLVNPGMLEMFRDRDRFPPRCMVAWAGEFAGKYLTHAVQIWRLTRDRELEAHLRDFVAQLVECQDTDGYLGP